MNIFLLGNGFDLHHNLPTAYINFINTIEYLKSETCIDEYKTVGDVFKKVSLQKGDDFIKKCYGKNKAVYNTTPLNEDKMKRVWKLSHENEWFDYMANKYRKNSTWIDFEKEIAQVCGVFSIFLSRCKGKNNCSIIKNEKIVFAYFKSIFSRKQVLTEDWDSIHLEYEAVSVRKEFKIEREKGAINVNAVIKALKTQLYEFSELLSLYIELFVESTIDGMIKEKVMIHNKLFSNIDHVFTLNYTNTFTKVYGQKVDDTTHIHGSVFDKIVLGIQADEGDETKDTDFIAFKKYYQRSIYGMEFNLNKKISDLKQSEDDIELSVMGHSLDITDKEIIKDLFGIASKITIYYYCKERSLDSECEAHGACVKKLIHIFGYEKYTEIARNTLLNYEVLPAIDNCSGNS